MKLARTRVAQVVADQTLKSGVTEQFSQEVAAYLLSEHRTNELDSVMRDVQANWAEAGYVEVIATSARDLTADLVKGIKQQIVKLYPAAKQIIVTQAYDPAVIGSVRLSLPNQQLDLSVQAKLNKFKQLTSNGKG